MEKFTLENAAEHPGVSVEREANPFEEKKGAEEWIYAVENERDTFRDKEIYPQLAAWISDCSPSVVVDLGAGQGICSSKLGDDQVQYFGIEPSSHLVARAEELYKKENRKFVVGDAYNIPLEAGMADACFSINVWFHLSDLEKPSHELARILKSGGHFLIITANPSAYDMWEGFYEDVQKDEKSFAGKIDILLNPNVERKDRRYAPISVNIFYTHSLEEMLDSLKKAGLAVDDVAEMGASSATDRKIFIKISGHKA